MRHAKRNGNAATVELLVNNLSTSSLQDGGISFDMHCVMLIQRLLSVIQVFDSLTLIFRRKVRLLASLTAVGKSVDYTGTRSDLSHAWQRGIICQRARRLHCLLWDLSNSTVENEKNLSTYPHNSLSNRLHAAEVILCEYLIPIAYSGSTPHDIGEM